MTQTKQSEEKMGGHYKWTGGKFSRSLRDSKDRELLSNKQQEK